MKAVRKLSPKRGAEIVDVPIPTITSHQVLAKVHATSICGTDYHIYDWDPWSQKRIKLPHVMGHEFCGEVVEVGPQVERIKVGDFISGETHIPCFTCYQCRTGQMHICNNVKILGVDCDGSFAEYVALPEVCCVISDPAIPKEIASIMEPLGNAVYTVSESRVAGKSVVIFGDGPIGIFAVPLARALGAVKIIVVGMTPYRLNLVRQFEPDLVIDATEGGVVEKIMEATRGSGVDVVLEMSGSPVAIKNGFQVVRKGGVFTFFGIPSKPVEINIAEDIIFKGIKMNAINGRKMFDTWEEMTNLLASGRLDVSRVVTHTFPLEKVNEAMELITPGQIQAGKIVLTV